MSDIYKLAQDYVTKVNNDEIFVEIGSDRWEGSTPWIADFAKNHSCDFYSVDINTDCHRRIHKDNIIWQTASGSHWAKHVLPSLNKKIKFLYLDNFDWMWNAYTVSEHIQNQVNEYQNRWGLTMNNENCQQEHFDQAVYVTPYLSDNAVIICDDTFRDNGAWTGKCAPALYWFKHNGFELVHADEKTNGIVLTRS